MGKAIKTFLDTGRLYDSEADVEASGELGEEEFVAVERKAKDRPVKPPLLRGMPTWPVTDFVTLRCDRMILQPHHCAEILAKRNTKNRSLPKSNVPRFAEIMQQGEWMLNGETVIFDWDGELRDGQTRLNSAVEANVPLDVFVAFGVDPDCFDTIDKGKKRSRSDDLGIAGESNTACLAAVLGVLWLEEQGMVDQIGRSEPLFPVWEVLDRHPDVRKYCQWVMSKHLGRLLPPRIGTYCYYRFSQRSQPAADRFFEDLLSGAGLEIGDPVLLLRNRLLDNRVAKAKLVQVEILALVIKAWNHRRKGRSIRCLKWKEENDTGGEKFPVPI
jgi:hypothetical protein